MRPYGQIACALIAIIATTLASRAFGDASSDRRSAQLAGPLTIEQCVLIALRQNPQLAASEQGVVGAGAALRRARSPYYPELTVGVVEGVSSDPIADGTETTEEAALVLRQTLWQSGLRESIDESAAQLESAQFGYAADVQSLIEEVAVDYYGVLAADRLVGVADAGAASARGHLEQVQARIEVGVAAEVDEATAQDDLARAELALIDARAVARVARARLKSTMGVPQQAVLDLAPPPALVADVPPALGDALAAAEQNRPDVLSAKAAVDASSSALKQAEIRSRPVADISGRYEWGYTDWTRRDPSWDVALALSWTLFDGYATQADITSARVSLARSEAQLQAVLDQVGLDVASALAEIERARERVTATAKSVAAAEARLEAAQGKYQQGVGILLEVTDARDDLTGAQANQVEADYDYRTALVGLQRVLGTLAAPEAEGGLEQAR